MNQTANQMKYGLIKAVNFTIYQLNRFCRIIIYSTHNERKSVVAEKFIRTLKNETYKYMTSISKKCVH